MRFLCHQPGRAGSFRQLFVFPAVTSLPSGERDVLGGDSAQSPGDTASVHQCHWEPRARGKHKGPVWAGGICPWGPPLQEADPPTGSCSDEGLIAKCTKAFSRQIHSLWKPRKQKSICMSSLRQVLSKGRSEWSDVCSHDSWWLFSGSVSW